VSRVVILDNEAVRALLSTTHPKHRRVLAHMDVIARRKARDRRRAAAIVVVVPTPVRVEAGWDRTAARAALANGLGIDDVPLGSDDANVAASVRNRLGPTVSVVDAHVGAVVARFAERDITLLTSDPVDMRAVADDMPVTIVTL
jgi:hypothetical protein